MARVIFEVWVRDASDAPAFDCLRAGPGGDEARQALKQSCPSAELSWMLAADSRFDALNYCASALLGRAHESDDEAERAPQPDVWAQDQRRWFELQGLRPAPLFESVPNQ